MGVEKGFNECGKLETMWERSSTDGGLLRKDYDESGQLKKSVRYTKYRKIEKWYKNGIKMV